MHWARKELVGHWIMEDGIMSNKIDSLDGVVVGLQPGQMIEVEEVLAGKSVLEKTMKLLLAEKIDCRRLESKMWRKLHLIAKEQYPCFDWGTHYLSWDWIERVVTIVSRKDSDWKEVLGDT